MGIILDVIIILIFLASAFLGYKKGLVNVIFNVLAFFIALVITFILYKPVTNLIINNTNLDEKISSIIDENGTIKSEETESEDKNDNKYIEKYVKDIAIDKANNVVEDISITLSKNIVGIIVIIGLFIISRIALILLKFVFNSIAELPLIKQFNEIGGLLYGILRGIMVVLIILAILFFIVSISNNKLIAELIDTSIITKIIYANNIILKIVF